MTLQTSNTKEVSGRALARAHKGLLKKRLGEVRRAAATSDGPAANDSAARTTIGALHILHVGNDPATHSFVRIKKRWAEDLGIAWHHHYFADEVATDDLITRINELQHGFEKQQSHAGIIVQLPLPDHVDTQKVLDTLLPQYDCDVLGSAAYELFKKGNMTIPPVAKAVWHALEQQGLDQQELSRMNIVIVGLGALVGRPCVDLFNSREIKVDTIDIHASADTRGRLLKNADLIISGVGIPGLITADQITEGVMLIDAGTSESAGVLMGDIDPGCYEKANWHTPVPGGIGPLTVAMVYDNLINSWYSSGV